MDIFYLWTLLWIKKPRQSLLRFLSYSPSSWLEFQYLLAEIKWHWATTICPQRFLAGLICPYSMTESAVHIRIDTPPPHPSDLPRLSSLQLTYLPQSATLRLDMVARLSFFCFSRPHKYTNISTFASLADFSLAILPAIPSVSPGMDQERKCDAQTWW